MRPISLISPLAALFHPLHAQLMSFSPSPLALEVTCNHANVAMIQPIAPLVDCCANLLCTVEKGETIAWQCTAEVSCSNRTEVPGRSHRGNSSTNAAGNWTARCSFQFSAAHNTGFHVTVDNNIGQVQNKADSRWSTALPGCPEIASQNSTAAEGTQPTTHSWRPSSGIALPSSKPTIRPRPIRTTLPTHDPKITSSATATGGTLTTTMTLVSTITVFLALAA